MDKKLYVKPEMAEALIEQSNMIACSILGGATDPEDGDGDD